VAKEILQYFSVITKGSTNESGTFVERGAALTQAQAITLNNKLKISGVADDPAIPAGAIDDAAYNKILPCVHG